jgi:hypothetical protein
LLVPRVLLVLAVLAATIFCIIDCIQSEDREIRNLPKIVWLLLILVAPIVGPIAWFVAGRPQPDRPVLGTPRPAVPRRPSAPDDDPTFLAGLDRTNDERRRLAAWERELEARERGLSGSTGADDESQPRDQREQDGPGDEPATRT